MDFKKKMEQRLYIAVSYIVLGLILVISAVIMKLENYFFSSFGITMIVMGLLRLIRYRNVTRDPQSIRKQEITETDERNRMIAERARSWSFSFSIFGAGIAVIILSFLGHHDTAMPFAWFVCGMVTLYWICWLIIRKKY